MILIALSCLMPLESRAGPRTDKIEITKKRMEAIVIPRADFQNASAGEVMKWLSEESKKLDPSGVGVDVLIDPETVELEKTVASGWIPLSSKKITLQTENQSLVAVINQVARLLGGKYEVGEGKVYLGWLID